MRLNCLLCIIVISSSITAYHSSWITLTGPAFVVNDNAKSPNVITSSSTNIEKSSNKIDELKDLYPSINENCCEYQDSEKEIEKSLHTISEITNEGKILDEIYSLIDDIQISIQKAVDNLTFAVFIPESKEERNDTKDLVWEYKEQSNTNEIHISLKREMVQEMEAKDIHFKLALLKYNIPANFKTKSRSETEYRHGPFIIIRTEFDREISIGMPVFQYKIDKQQLKYPNAEWKCVFWNKENSAWEIRGMVTFNDNNKHVICTSDHLSAFSIVMDPYLAYDEDIYSELFTIVSIVGSFLTVPCLFATVVVYHRNRIRREKISSKILIYCCLSLLLLHFSFLLFTLFRNVLPCWFLNFILHYGGSSSLLWTAADGVNMWRKLFVDIFDKKKHVFFRWSKILSWGLPLLTSVIGVMLTDYSKKKCQIGFEHNLLLYIMPCALVLTVNVVFFTIMFVNVVCKDRIKSLSEKKKKYVMSLIQVFGLLWCIAFPFLWLPETRIVAHIIFTIFISNQGIFIFYIRCVNEREIRKELLRCACYRKVFYRVLTISTYNRNSSKNCKNELTGIFSITSGNTNSFLSTSEFST